MFGHSHGPGHRAAAGVMTAESAALMQPVDEVVLLLGRDIACGVDQAVVRAGAGPVPCD